LHLGIFEQPAENDFFGKPLRPPRLSGEIYALTSPAPTEVTDFTDLYTISDNICCPFFGLLCGRKNGVDKMFLKHIISHHRIKLNVSMNKEKSHGYYS